MEEKFESEGTSARHRAARFRVCAQVTRYKSSRLSRRAAYIRAIDLGRARVLLLGTHWRLSGSCSPGPSRGRSVIPTLPELYGTTPDVDAEISSVCSRPLSRGEKKESETKKRGCCRRGHTLRTSRPLSQSRHCLGRGRFLLAETKVAFSGRLGMAANIRRAPSRGAGRGRGP